MVERTVRAPVGDDPPGARLLYPLAEARLLGNRAPALGAEEVEEGSILDLFGGDD